ncbi:hypothetical protein [Armatimonas rosea]|uniref:FtsW/RodA/SpoVE family cell cycle protein n=1 Tax=Armatimonas rosea TaxID=685828 RepID=A0A7W9W9M9_ARMRO|nr:hypothetical protein [Armatimonas rosea]MBB6052742.1 hypothetical protein [Armatimonas rosea]
MSVLALAALPAFLGSLFLMQRGGAGLSQLIQQVVAFSVAALAFVLTSRKPLSSTETSRGRALMGVVVLLVLPLLAPGAGPHRWLGVGGFRLYMASVLLPGAVPLLPQTRSAWIALLAIAAALAAQPDASQVTAFALAGLVVLWRAPLSGLARVGVGVALAGATAVAWLRPDPLEPVAYVEGVLVLAQQVGMLALGFALIALALPVAMLLRMGHVAVAVYYAAILFFAYRQLTPMPLLGFGVGPILGYFAMAILCRPQEVKE